MENAADALKIAFGLLVFATAITMLFIMVSHTRETADITLNYADDTRYYAWTNSSDRNRIATVSDVITTLYRYNNESVAVKIILNDEPGKVFVFDVNNETDKDGNRVSLTSSKEQEDNLADFIENKLIHKNMTFKETFAEVPTTGIYEYDSVDNSELTLSTGNRKIFITYEEI